MASLLGKPLKIISTASATSGVQFRLGYDVTNRADFKVSSAGDLTIAPSGGDTSVTGTLAVSSTLSVAGDVSIADKIIHTGDTNTAIRFPAGDTVTVETSGSERLRIDSSGRVGIGVTPFSAGGNGENLMIGNPATDAGAGLTIGSTTTGDIQFGDATSGTGRYAGLIRYEHANDALSMWTSSTERMRIDSSGNVGIGDTSPLETLHVIGGIGLQGSNDNRHLSTRINIRKADLADATATNIFTFTKGAGAALSTVYSAFGGQLNIAVGMRFDGGYNIVAYVQIPFVVGCTGSNNLSLTAGTPVVVETVNTTGGTNSYTLSLSATSNTSATLAITIDNSVRTMATSDFNFEILGTSTSESNGTLIRIAGA